MRTWTVRAQSRCAIAAGIIVAAAVAGCGSSSHASSSYSLGSVIKSEHGTPARASTTPTGTATHPGSGTTAGSSRSGTAGNSTQASGGLNLTGVPSTSAVFVTAAQTSSGQPGYRFQMTTDEHVGTNHVVVTGSGTYSTEANAGAFKLSFAGATVQRATDQEIYRNGNVYVKMSGNSGVASGKWIVLNLADARKLSGNASVESFLSAANTGRSPGEMFDYLHGETADVVNLGSATVNGVKTTHYSATLDVTKVLAEIDHSGEQSTGFEFAQILAHANTSDVPVQVWIDSSNLVRKLVLSVSEKVRSVGTLHSTVTMTFPQYGSQPVPAVPPANATVSLTNLLKTAG